MPQFKLVFERSAVEVRTLVIDADSMAQACEIFSQELDRIGPNKDPDIVSDDTHLFGDDESSWDCVEEEEVKP